MFITYLGVVSSGLELNLFNEFLFPFKLWTKTNGINLNRHWSLSRHKSKQELSENRLYVEETLSRKWNIRKTIFFLFVHFFFWSLDEKTRGVIWKYRFHIVSRIQFAYRITKARLFNKQYYEISALCVSCDVLMCVGCICVFKSFGA